MCFDTRVRTYRLLLFFFYFYFREMYNLHIVRSFVFIRSISEQCLINNNTITNEL